MADNTGMAMPSRPRRAAGHAIAGLLVLLLAGCGSLRPQATPSPATAPLPAATPKASPESAASGQGPRQELPASADTETSPPRETRGDGEAPLLETGIASWYGKPFHGRRTANGERYDMNALTAAHKTLPLPSYARVRNPANGREVVVRVNDRGPFRSGRIIDLSRAAARQLGIDGLATVEVQRLPPDELCAGRWGPAPAKLACASGDGAR